MLTDIQILTAKDLHEWLILQYTICRNKETRDKIISQIISLTNEIRDNMG